MKTKNSGYNNKAISILRVSSNRQKDNTSHELQGGEVKAYADKNSLDIVKVFQFVESAKDAEDRKKFRDAIKYAVNNGIYNVLFYQTDRESRNFTDIEANEKLVLDGIIAVHYVRDNKMLHKDSPPSDFLMRQFQALQDKQVSVAIRTKVNDAMCAKAENGWYPSNTVPLGYICQETCDEFGRKHKRGKIVGIDPDECNVRQVQREFQLRAQGLSYETVRKTILAEGLVDPRKSSSYRTGSIEKRLKNKFYRGLFEWKGIEYQGKHPLIIPKDVLDAVDATFGNKRPIKKSIDTNGIFSGGWIKCGIPGCGCHLVFDPKKKVNKQTGETRVYTYYHCTNGKRIHASLKGMSVSQDMIMNQLSSSLDRFTITPEFAQVVADALNKNKLKAREAIMNQAEGYKAALADLIRKEDDAYDRLDRKEIDSDTYQRQIKRIREERNQYTDFLTQINVQISDQSLETAKSVLELASSMKTLWNTWSDAEKRDQLDLVLSNSSWDGSTVRYDLKKPFAVLADMRGNLEWRTRVEEFRTACVSCAA